MFGWCLVISLHTWFSDVSHKGPNKGCICWTWPRCLSNIPGLEKSKKKKFQVSTSWVMSQKYTKNELLRQTQNVWAQGVIASFCSGRSSSMQTEQFRSFAALFRLKSYITIDQEPWFLIYVLSLCYVMLCYVASCVQLHKNTPSVFIDCSSGLPVAKAATVRRKKSMELEASWSSHKFWALPMGFLRFDGNGIRCHTCSFPCEISIFSNKAPWQSVISESFKYSNNAPTNLFICLSHLEVRIHQNFPVCQDTCRAGEWKSEGSDAQRTPDLFWVDPIQGCGSCPGGNKTHQYEYTWKVNQEKKRKMK